MNNYTMLNNDMDFSTEFPTYILGFCPDTDTWFATNKRFFFYEYEKEFQTKDEAELFFCKNAQMFYDLEINKLMKEQHPSILRGIVRLEVGNHSFDTIDIKVKPEEQNNEQIRSKTNNAKGGKRVCRKKTPTSQAD